MHMRSLMILGAAAAMLAGCAGDPSLAGLTDEQIGQVQRDRYMTMQQGQQPVNNYGYQMLQQVAPTPIPQVAPIGQPNSTAIVYCRDLTGSIVACKQIQ